MKLLVRINRRRS